MSRPQTNLGPRRWALRVDVSFLRNPVWRKWGLVLVVFGSLLSMAGAPLWTHRYNFTVGEVAPYDVEANRTVVDRERTERLQAEARKRAVEQVLQDPASYVINPAVGVEAERDVETVYSLLREAGGGATGSVGGGQAPRRPNGVTPEGVARRVREETGLDLPVSTVAGALRRQAEELRQDETHVKEVVSRLLTQERVSEESLEAWRQKASDAVRQLGVADPRLAALVAAGVLRPNLELDPDRLSRAERASHSVEPVQILKGQTIIRRGDIVTAEHVRLLQLLGLQRTQATWVRLGGAALLLLLLLAVLGVYLWHFQPEILRDENLFALLGFILVMLALTARLLSSIGWSGAGFVIPIAFGTMLAAILLDSRLAVLVTVVMAVFTGLVTEQDPRFVLVALAGGLAGVFGVSRVSQRGDLMRAGLIVGTVDALTIAGLGFFSADPVTAQSAWLGMVNGILSSVLAIGSLAYLETIFGLTSAVRLLELSNPNQPLLRRLLLEAPGTYHHSVMVGNLAEAAAEAVHGDPLLARVGAYFHDIGKIRRPYFFAENQFAGENPHDKLAPGLSTLIITSHVKDGVELAREAKLPTCVVDFIRQHHGTDLVRYFYRRAVETARENGVNERDFRYQGPKPQTKEAAIVMLADSVEAAVKGLQKPTPGRVEGLVRKLLKDRLVDGQLDESNLTLKDLDRIADAFVRVLSGMFHTRVEYPDSLARELETKRGPA